MPPQPPPPPSTRRTPQERAQARTALRAELERESRAKAELVELQRERHAVVENLKALSANHKELQRTLEHYENENERWQTPNANLGEIYRLRHDIEQSQWQIKECHRRWDQLGDEIEEKHVEIAFGGDGGE